MCKTHPDPYKNSSGGHNYKTLSPIRTHPCWGLVTLAASFIRPKTRRLGFRNFSLDPTSIVATILFSAISCNVLELSYGLNFAGNSKFSLFERLACISFSFQF